MGKALVVADIHIHDYPNRNPENDYRLKQDRVVARNIIEVGKNNGCDTIIFAGDIIEKSLIRSYIQAEVKEFLHAVMANFKDGYIIWGNHDQENKSSDQDINDSVLGVILPPNLHYVHQRIVKLGNTEFAFSNWQPEFDLGWIPRKVDILITHATICYSQNSDLYQSQILDENKFNLAICGDIHKPGEIGKYVSVGVAQKCKMGDSDQCTGIVVDYDSKAWTRVNLNPHDNLMKFIYTNDLSKEGWDEKSNTWLVYKKDVDPNTGNLLPTSYLPAWEKIESLVDGMISNEGLSEVHQEVLRNVKDINAGEVDFNFTLISLHCKNWRSIDDITIYFSDGDRILIRGANGSGKSSLLSALKYAFIDVRGSGLRSLDSFIQFGSRDCMTEVEFMYQGNTCKLTRGTKVYGLEINGVSLKYNNKSTFELDVRQRFPFIEYMDIFFLDSDHNQLIGGMTDERRNLIISKFLKLDKIDTLHDTAVLMNEQVKKEVAVWQEKFSQVSKVLEVLIEKANSIKLPSINRDVLIDQKNRGLEIHKKSLAWNNYVLETARIDSTISEIEKRIAETQDELKAFPNLGALGQKVIELEEEKSNLEQNLQNLRTALGEEQFKRTQMAQEGNNIWTELQGIKIGGTCSHCGQVIQTPESLLNHKSELESKLEYYRKEIAELDKRISDITQEGQSLSQKSSQRISEIKTELGTLNAQIQRYNFLENTYRVEYGKLEVEKENKSKLQAPEKVELPENFMAIMDGINHSISVWDLYNNTCQEVATYRAEAQNYESELQKYGNIMADLGKYIILTGPVGSIYHEIFKKLASEFSDSMVKYEVTKFIKNNKDHLDLISKYNNNGNLVEYVACSSGQKTVLDIHFMRKVISRVGLVVLDEFLKHLDPENTEAVVEMLGEINIGCMMLSSHMESISAFNNKTCRLSLNSSGLTKIELE